MDVTPLSAIATVLCSAIALPLLGQTGQVNSPDIGSWIQTGGTVGALVWMTVYLSGQLRDQQKRFDLLLGRVETMFERMAKVQESSALAMASMSSAVRHLRDEVLIIRENVPEERKDRIRKVLTADDTPT